MQVRPHCSTLNFLEAVVVDETQNRLEEERHEDYYADDGVVGY